MRTRTFLLAAVAAAAVAGCGGDDNEALTYDGFIEAANGVCQTAESSINQASEGLTGNPKRDLEIYDELIPALEDATDAIGDLDPPEELQDPYNDFVAATDAQLDGARDAQAAAEAGDTAEYQRILEDIQPYADDADEAGSKMGAADCVD
jgi:hypothetical protein